jgi:hypothetical protein
MKKERSSCWFAFAKSVCFGQPKYEFGCLGCYSR